MRKRPGKGADDHGRRVVGAVVVRARLVVRIVPFLVALAELLEALARLGPHWLERVRGRWPAVRGPVRASRSRPGPRGRRGIASGRCRSGRPTC